MAKTTKTVWVCSDCGADSAKWSGRCPSCGAWNTMKEFSTGPSRTRGGSTLKIGASPMSRPVEVTKIESLPVERLTMPSGEFNRVLGGGLVAGSLVLVGGEPGIGKSTLVLQNSLRVGGRKVLYVSGEESPQQIKMRADRIGRLRDNVYIACETNLEIILRHAEELQPGMLVIDSIQTIASDNVESAAGSVSQVRECAARLLEYAKTTGVPVIIIGHITKEGSLAGPKTLEHIVDTVVQFEGDNQHLYRLLRPIKNRFGSTSELGIYEMGQTGLREVTNPSELLFGSQTAEGLSGIAVGVTVDGVRSFLIETQALVSTAAYGTAQRSVQGFDGRRLNMLLAVLEKRSGFKLAQKDVFLNIAGGLKVNDPALDLSVVAAVMSSNVDTPLPAKTAMTGEVGLSGEIRPVTRIEQRIGEARRLGMERILVPKGSLKGIAAEKEAIQIIEVAKVGEAFKALFA